VNAVSERFPGTDVAVSIQFVYRTTVLTVERRPSTARFPCLLACFERTLYSLADSLASQGNVFTRFAVDRPTRHTNDITLLWCDGLDISFLISKWQFQTNNPIEKRGEKEYLSHNVGRGSHVYVEVYQSLRVFLTPVSESFENKETRMKIFGFLRNSHRNLL
jgi:hypothetical protein